MDQQTTLIRNLGGQTAVANLETLDDDKIHFVLAINGAITDVDTATFDSEPERDEAYRNTINVFVDEGGYEVLS